jgi:hypothetical protein
MVLCKVPSCEKEAVTYNEELGADLCLWHNYYEEIPTTKALLSMLSRISKIELILYGKDISIDFSLSVRVDSSLQTADGVGSFGGIIVETEIA